VSQSTLSLVKKIDGLLEELSSQLAVSVNPHRLAIQSLGVREYGWIETPYGDEAFQTWSELLRQNPDDIDTLHHLAIMHHARAMDLETSEDPRRSDADWERSLEYWHRLWQSQAFWDRIADSACKNEKRDAVERLREQFPILLLQVHFDVAFDPQTKNYRANYHLKTALQSQFPDEAKEAVRKDTYDRVMSGVPPTIWQPTEMNTEVIKEGTDRIKQYLELDTGCVPALVDALRLQDRLLGAWFTRLRGLGDEDGPERRALLNTMKKAADEWQPYLKQLVPLAKRLEDTSRNKLSVWMRVMGDVLRALDKRADAISYYQNGKDAGRQGSDERKMSADRLGETHAYLARERASKKEASARAYCDEVRKRTELTVTAHFILAQAYLELKAFDIAAEVCRAGQAVEVDTGNFEAMQGDEEIRHRLAGLLKQIPDQRDLSQATDLMLQKRFSEALPILDRAVARDPDLLMAYFLRCQCYMGCHRKADARGDLKRLRKLFHTLDPAEAAQVNAAAETLEKQIETMA
jgi:tetratricopeptide (TPR) repeat protein